MTTAAPQLTAIHCRSCARVLIMLAPGIFRRPVTLTCPDCGQERVLPPFGHNEIEKATRVCYTDAVPA